ncbi:hypothetical protein B0H14DRAFT_3515585 [Mycena olivaceomarginata]|nr:hypothetical protein B0H14DRAFT_3515585 [Mycena olivaceomarginata]
MSHHGYIWITVCTRLSSPPHIDPTCARLRGHIISKEALRWNSTGQPPPLPLAALCTHNTSWARSAAFSTPHASITGVWGYCHTRGAPPLVHPWNTPATPSPFSDDKHIHSFPCSLVHRPQAALGCNLQDLWPYKHWIPQLTSAHAHIGARVLLFTVLRTHLMLHGKGVMLSRFRELSPRHTCVAMLATSHALAHCAQYMMPVDTKCAVAHLTSNGFERVRVQHMHTTACSTSSGSSVHQDASRCRWTRCPRLRPDSPELGQSQLDAHALTSRA